MLARAVRQQKEMKGIQIEKNYWKEVKISPFADDMIVYISDPNNSTRELLILINSFSAVAGYKINSNKSVAFLYTKNKQDEKKIRETTPLTIVTNNIKYLGVTLTKEVKDLYDKNLKSLKKEIRETTPFKIVKNNIKYLGVTKEVKDLYDKNFKSLKKEIKEYLRKWKDL